MNLQQLRYAAEVERTGSITQAAENLFMSQPNLSRAIRELESGVGIEIFRRTPHGIELTDRGSDFMQRARDVLMRVEDMERMGKVSDPDIRRLSVCAPAAEYASHAFIRLSGSIGGRSGIDLSYCETTSSAAFESVLSGRCGLAIVRYPGRGEGAIVKYASEKGLALQRLIRFEYAVLMSREHPLASGGEVAFDRLLEFTELMCGDSSPRPPVEFDSAPRRVTMLGCGGRLDLLRRDANAFMWTSPVPQDLLDFFGLVQLRCKTQDTRYVDSLVWDKRREPDEMERRYISELKKLVGGEECS